MRDLIADGVDIRRIDPAAALCGARAVIAELVGVKHNKVGTIHHENHSHSFVNLRIGPFPNISVAGPFFL